MDTYEVFELLLEQLGAEELASEIYNYFGTWKMDSCLESIATDHDINIESDEEEECQIQF